MKPAAHGWWLALLGGAALVMYPLVAQSVPDDPVPTGFAWEELKEIHSRLLRPEKWFFRRVVEPIGWAYHFAPQPFEGEGQPKNGLTLAVVTKVRAQQGKSADEFGASLIAEFVSKGDVKKGWTRKGEPLGPFTTTGLVCLMPDEDDGRKYMLKIVCIANRDTDTLYAFVLASPRAEWKDVEQWGDKMIASLRLDPKL